MELTDKQLEPITFNADEIPRRELNVRLRELLQEGAEVVVTNPRSRHNLGVALPGPGRVRFEGSVGYYCGGLNDGAHIEVTGNAGWGTGEAMARGFIRVRGNTGQGTGASMRGGTIVVEGDADARCAVAQKGGNIIVAGRVGFLSGFMAQVGNLIVLGDAADGLGDSLYEGNIYVAGRIEGLGVDAKIELPTPQEIDEIEELVVSVGLTLPDGREWKKVVAERKLWYFDKREADTWLKI
jgi:glutamate synthase domain-containing protein 3